MPKTAGHIFEDAIYSGVTANETSVPQSDVDKARAMLRSAGIDPSWLKTPQEAGIKSGRMSPKTDLYVLTPSGQEYKISAKYNGKIQLCSVNRNTAASMFALAAEKANINSKGLDNFIEKFKSSLPKGVSEREYYTWADNHRDLFLKEMEHWLKEYPELNRHLTEIALTGNGLFEDKKAIANCIITENKFVMITDDYTKKCSKIARIDFRKKSRKSKTDNEACFRMDADLCDLET
jgi:hypothetical protein